MHHSPDHDLRGTRAVPATIRSVAVAALCRQPYSTSSVGWPPGVSAAEFSRYLQQKGGRWVGLTRPLLLCVPAPDCGVHPGDERHGFNGFGGDRQGMPGIATIAWISRSWRPGQRRPDVIDRRRIRRRRHSPNPHHENAGSSMPRRQSLALNRSVPEPQQDRPDGSLISRRSPPIRIPAPPGVPSTP